MFKKWFGFGKNEEPSEPIETQEAIQESTQEATESALETVAEAVDEFVEETVQEQDELAQIEAEIEDTDVELPIQENDQDEDAENSSGFFKRLINGLDKTRKGIVDRIDQAVNQYGEIDEELFNEIEEILITSDVGMDTTLKLVENLRKELTLRKVKTKEGIHEALAAVMEHMLTEGTDSTLEKRKPSLYLVIGVNGAGKTTSIGKIAHRMKQDGHKVLLAAADTFRAAAIDQLRVWGDRTGVPVIAHQEGSDPAAVIFDAIQAAKSRDVDFLICDTAGRLHNKKNLMNELEKIFRIIEREWPEAHKEVLLVLDATTGQNAVQQARLFKETAHITGIVLTKLDGTAKGGVVLTIQSELGIPVKLIGVGERMTDLQPFVAADFVRALMEMPQESTEETAN